MQIIYIVLSIYDVYMNSERWHNEYIMSWYIYMYSPVYVCMGVYEENEKVPFCSSLYDLRPTMYNLTSTTLQTKTLKIFLIIVFN